MTMKIGNFDFSSLHQNYIQKQQHTKQSAFSYVLFCLGGGGGGGGSKLQQPQPFAQDILLSLAAHGH